MNEVEKRRMQLLQDVRKKYSDKNAPPAIHPRYSSTYHSLYHEEIDDDSIPQSTFIIRLMIAGLIFAVIFVMDYRKEEVVNVNTETIVNVLQDDLFSK